MIAMSRLFRPLQALVLPLALASCAMSPSPQPEVVEAQRIPTAPALWKVADEDTTIYLFGTVHTLPKDVEWFKGPIQQAFASSEELITEVEVGDARAMQQALTAKAVLPQEQSLRDLMNEADRQKFEEALVSLGLPVDALDRFEPWYAAMTLAVLPLAKAGYTAESGVEMVLSAGASDKKRGALETLEQQVELFDGLPQDAQLTFLNQTVESLFKLEATIAQMVANWLEGDAAELATLLNSELDDPVLRDRLLIQRNANWAQWIDERLDRPGTVFLAVGAGHLAGEDSVQEQLSARDIKVVRVVQ